MQKHFQPGPLGGLEGNSRANPEQIGHHGPKTAERGDKTHLPELHPDIFVQSGHLKTHIPLLLKHMVFSRVFEHPEDQQRSQSQEGLFHG
jgi:hypothetical protein